tara:strand:- start:253 stop:894 length:642 start_codon:yes stop_codon:yes gene_type:complete
MKKVIIILLFPFLIYTNSHANTGAGDVELWIGGSSGSGDMRLNGTKYDVDFESVNYEFTAYLPFGYIGGSFTDYDYDLSGNTLTGEFKTISAGIMIPGQYGRLNLITGEGSHSKLGVNYSDYEVSINGGASTSDNTTNLALSLSGGIGNGFGAHLSWSTPTDEFLDDNTWSISATKSVGPVILEFGYQYNIWLTDSRNFGDESGVIYKIGTQF